MIKAGIKAYKFAKTFKKYKKADSEAEQIKAAKLLGKIFENEGGLFLKVAQYIGTDKGQAEEIQNLSLRIDPILSKDLFIELIEKNLDQKWSEVFSEISDEAFSASIGQVQKGKLLSGEEVAIKVQYPFIKEKLHEQVKLLNLIPTGIPEKKWGVDIAQYKQMIKNLLDNETDYTLESKLQNEAFKAFKSYKYIKAPKLYEELSTDKILITEFINGFNVNDIEFWSDMQRVHLAENLLKTFITMIREEYFQADSNHGNFLFIKEKQKIGVIDFGQFKKLDKSFSMALISLIYKLCRNEKICYGDYFVALGFAKNKLSKIDNTLEILANIIFEPFTKDYPYLLSDWKYKTKIDLALGDDKWWFRSAGGEEFFLLMKSFMGVKNLIDKMSVNLNWQKIFFEVINDYELELKEFTPPVITKSESDMQFMGNFISVKIIESGSMKVQLRLGIGVLFDFKETIGEDIVDKLEKEDIDVEQIAKDALRSGAKPGKLFEVSEPDKNIIVEII